MRFLLIDDCLDGKFEPGCLCCCGLLLLSCRILTEEGWADMVNLLDFSWISISEKETLWFLTGKLVAPLTLVEDWSGVLWKMGDAILLFKIFAGAPPLLVEVDEDLIKVGFFVVEVFCWAIDADVSNVKGLTVTRCDWDLTSPSSWLVRVEGGCKIDVSGLGFDGGGNGFWSKLSRDIDLNFDMS